MKTRRLYTGRIMHRKLIRMLCVYEVCRFNGGEWSVERNEVERAGKGRDELRGRGGEVEVEVEDITNNNIIYVMNGHSIQSSVSHQLPHSRSHYFHQAVGLRAGPSTSFLAPLVS